MRWELRIAGLIAAFVVFITGISVYNHGQREIGRRDILLAQTRADLKRAQRRADSLETVYRVDTLRLWRTVRAMETLTVTVDRWKHDTTEVVRYVVRADSTIKACTATVRTCEERVSAEHDARTAAERQVQLLRASLTPKRTFLKGAAVGALSLLVAQQIR